MKENKTQSNPTIDEVVNEFKKGNITTSDEFKHAITTYAQSEYQRGREDILKVACCVKIAENRL